MARLSQAIGRIAPSPTVAVTTRANELKAEGRDVLGLGAGEPDFPVPEHAREAAIQAIRDGKSKYTAPDGTPELKDAVREKFARDNGLEFTRDEISVNVGGKHTIFNALMATLDAGDEVIIPAPYWVSYPDIVSFAGATPVIVSGGADQGFKITPEQLEEAIGPQTKWFIFNSPSNPTGAAYTKVEIEGLIEVLRRHPHVWIMADDIYEHIVYEDFAFHTVAELAPDLRERTLTINGASKAYSMTGWRIGFAGGPKPLIAAMRKLQSQSTTNPCAIAQEAARAALTGPQDFLKERAAVFQKRRDLVLSMLGQADGLTLVKPQGAFYVYPDCGGMIGKRTPGGSVLNSDEDVATYLLEAEGCAVVHGAAFGLSPAFRVSYAVSTEVLEDACTRIQRACAALD
ncbi:aspartate aminotransferase [Pacificimonas flava]|uniref:Aminotransferase n=2 Tax=Pacificimonas TaxID=1960290 RepID=A0A219B485_9SPHN|nr:MULTISPECIES: pyridoxal phosphate-dependent aminotransferase [Pacificimonas]MBZ6377065.1 pyridoxal phosphate-dependent aminotransferase [Pacificimonas aurantium]OWV33200.1 aspartate aminotransferase [Pacificimonas flava]